jgi:hypothetical protein
VSNAEPAPAEPVALKPIPRGRPRSAGHALAIVASERREIAKKVVDLSQRHSLGNSIQRGSKNGKRYICLTFARPNRKDHVLDVSFLLDLPNLTEPFLAGLRARCAELLSERSRVHDCNELALGLCTYLKTYHPTARLKDLRDDVLTSFVKWQDSPAASRVGLAALATGTSHGRVQVGMRMLEALRDIPPWSLDAADVLAEYPRNTHPGRHFQVTPHATLPSAELEQILYAAIVEINAIRARLDEGERLLAEGQILLAAGAGQSSREYRASPALILAALVGLSPTVLPAHETLRASNPDLLNAIIESGGLSQFARYRYASSRDLVPFVIALTIEGAYNPDTVLGLTWAGVRPKETLGASLTTVEGPKARASNGISGKDLDPAVVDPWFDLLRRLTSRLQDALPEHEKGRVFVFSPESKGTQAKAFGSKTSGASSDTPWQHGLKRFRKHHDLPNFSLTNLRSTMLDLVGQREGSIAASQAGNHKNFQTTEGHYIGPGTRERERERLGFAVLQMERYLGTRGKIDPRLSVRPNGMDQTAATPGFGCSDSYDSPIPGQRKGRFCRAFGRCPGCALVGADFEDPLAVAYWLALLDAMAAARDLLDPPQWLATWGREVAIVISMLDDVSPDVMAEARNLIVYLPPVG